MRSKNDHQWGPMIPTHGEPVMGIGSEDPLIWYGPRDRAGTFYPWGIGTWTDMTWESVDHIQLVQDHPVYKKIQPAPEPKFLYGVLETVYDTHSGGILGEYQVEREVFTNLGSKDDALDWVTEREKEQPHRPYTVIRFQEVSVEVEMKLSVKLGEDDEL